MQNIDHQSGIKIPNKQQLVEDLSLFSLDNDTNQSLLWNNFRAFYRLDQPVEGASLEALQVRHYVGKVSVQNYEIVMHYLLPKKVTDHCLLIHGLFDHSALWRHYIHFWLQRGTGIFMFDLPGHGLSTGLEVAIDSFAEYQQALQAVIRMIKMLGIQEFFAMGQSTGGAILSDYLLSCRRHSMCPMVSKAFLLAPLVRPYSWLKAQLAHSILSPLVDYVPRRKTVNSNDAEFNYFLSELDPLQSKWLSAKWVGALKKWVPYFKQLPESEMDMLILQGEKDTTVDYDYNLRILQKKFPNAEQVMLPDAFHHLMGESVEQQLMMRAAIEQFLSKK